MGNKVRFRGKRKGAGFVMPPEGTFELQIVGADPSKTSGDGDPQVVVKFAIADGPHEGVAFRQYYTLSEERGWAFRNLCEVAGLDVEDLNEDEDDDIGEFDVDVDDLNERYIRARIEINEGNNGKKYVNLRDEEASTFQQSVDEEDPEPEPEPAPKSKPRRRRPPPPAS